MRVRIRESGLPMTKSSSATSSGTLTFVGEILVFHFWSGDICSAL